MQGTAMGTKMAPKYTNIFKHQLQTKLMSQSSKKTLQYLHYIDDIWMVWTHGKDTLLELIDNANRLHPTIKFTYLLSPETVNFLDTTVHLINNHIKTELYTKPTAPANTFFPTLATHVTFYNQKYSKKSSTMYQTHLLYYSLF